MNGYEQPVYEQPVAEPAQSAGPSRRGLVVAIAAGVILIAAVVAGVLLWRASRRPAPEAVSTEARIQREETLCSTTEHPENCRDQALLAIAQETGQGDICGRLQGEARDLCTYRDAQRNGNADRCKALSTEDLRSGCADVILLAAAQASGDAATCDRVTDPGKAASCHAAIETAMTAEACRAQGRDAAFCDDVAKKEAAIAAGDLALCDVIASQERRETCEDLVGGSDADGDGLTAHSERSYGTNPRNPDTDGDSFSDGTEVSGGYNPNGPGKL